MCIVFYSFIVDVVVVVSASMYVHNARMCYRWLRQCYDTISIRYHRKVYRFSAPINYQLMKLPVVGTVLAHNHNRSYK